MDYGKVLKLKCAVQTYAWGKPGSSSTVAKLCQNNPDFVISEKTTYAEYWMGTHPKGASKIIDNHIGECLLETWINNHPDVLGNDVNKAFNGCLPFLFKVLSVNKALSIQAHPNKKLASCLNKEQPVNYPDSNHKPEMAIALTKFEGLCGFRPLSEIAHFLEHVVELQVVVGKEQCAAFITAHNGNEDENIKKDCLKTCFTSLMNRDASVVSDELSKLVNRLKEDQSKQVLTCSLKELFLRLHSQFPGDVGCFCIFFLNYMVLSPGQAMFLGPNVPHAYLLGDCVECMACSDNTVRAGLTPKFRDVKNLCEMLEYNPGSEKDNLFESISDNSPYVTIYNPPVRDFAVRKFEIPKCESMFTITPINGPSILLVIEGEGLITEDREDGNLSVSPGTTLFCPANHPLTINKSDCVFLIFQAYCEV